MAALNDVGARVVLIGTGLHSPDSGLYSLSTVERSVQDLGKVLLERCGLAEDRLRVVIDATTPAEIGTALVEQAERATSVLLVYYVGHGLVGSGGELYLAAQSTDSTSSRLPYTALAYSAVRSSLFESRATSVVVVLDCCYSGRALGVLGSIQDDAIYLARVHGAFVLSSAAPDELALAPEGDTYTTFTGEFLKLLRDGDPDGPRHMTPESIYRYLAHVLPARGGPRPQRVASGWGDDLILAANPAYQPAPPTARPQLRPSSNVCPYPGLAAYQPEQAPWFFGRDGLIADLATRLAGRLAGGGPLMVVAPSGAGKSSLLRAGLIPALDRGELTPSGSRWPHVLMTPGPHPLAALAAKIAPLAGADAAGLASSFWPDPGHGAERLRDVLSKRAPGRDIAGSRVIVIVDQFEEVFTLCEEETERRAFIALLGVLASGTREAEPAGLVVIGLRADFYGRCAAYPELREAVEHDQILVGPMSTTELREAIERPAQAVGLELEPGLTELLLRDIGADDGGEAGARDNEAGRLPLIAYALRATWERRSDSTLTVAGYQDTGGIRRAIVKAAEDTYKNLPEASQQATRSLFLRLVKIGEGTQDTRRSVSEAELLSRGPTSSSAEAALKEFTGARLLTTSEDSVQISHEALLQAWPRLRQWISDDRAGNLLGQRLEDEATVWERAGRDSSALLRGSRLDAALNWARDRTGDGDVSPVVGSFLSESRRQQVRAGHIRRAGVAVLAVVALVAATTAWLAVNRSGAAEASSREAILSQVTAEADQAASTDTSLAAELNVLVYQMKPSNATYTKLISAQDTPLASVLPVSSGTPYSIAFSPKGNSLAAATGAGVQLWNVSSSSVPRPLGSPLPTGSGSAASVAFSPQGDLLAAATSTGVHLWAISSSSTARPRSLLAVASGPADSIAFGPDGDILAVATDTGVQLWNLSIPSDPAFDSILPTSSVGTVNSVAFSPDGRTLAVAGLSLQLWNVASPAAPRVAATIAPLGYYSGHLSPFLSVAFSPDGRLLAAGAADAAVHLWGAADPARPVSFGEVQNDTESVTSVAFSPNSDLLVTGSADDQAWVYNVTNADVYADSWFLAYLELTGHTGAILAVGMSPGGSTLATASADHTIRLWHLPRTVLFAQSGFVDGLALSPSRDILASGGYGGTMTLWNVANPAAPTDLSGAVAASGVVNSISFRPDGRLLAAAEHNVVQLWQVSDPRHPVRIGPPLPGFGPNTSAFYVTSVAFSPDGRTLAVGSFNHTVQLWNVANPADPVAVGPSLPAVPAQGVESVCFSPNGRTLAVGGDDGKIRLWDVADPAHPVPLGSPLTGNAGSIDAVAFSPDGQTLASGDAAGSVELWNLKDPARASMLGQPLTGQTSDIYSLAFSPDGHTLASGSLDHSIRLWNVADPSRAQEIGGPLTGDTGGINALVFGAGGHVLIAGDGSYAVRIWSLDAVTAIQRICATTANVLTPAVWHQYVQELPYNPPCGTTQ